MKKLLLGALAAILVAATAHPADAPSYIGKTTSTPEDTQAINKVIDDFQAAIKKKDVQLLSSLVVDEKLLWASPPPPEQIRAIRKDLGQGFNGIFPGAFRNFSQFIGSSKVPLEERFYNVHITQDANVAWVMFDYEFVEDNRVTNHGIETWQMMKSADGTWKIASVFWSTHMLN
ncbi:MAG: YybH family protein [Telluria sp.]